MQGVDYTAAQCQALVKIRMQTVNFGTTLNCDMAIGAGLDGVVSIIPRWKEIWKLFYIITTAWLSVTHSVVGRLNGHVESFSVTPLFSIGLQACVRM